MTQPVDVSLAISASWIIPIIPKNRVYTDCTLVIADEKIVDLIPTRELENRYTPKQVINLDGHALLPGLINAHGHAGMTLLRGYADDIPLEKWLQNHIWPAESQWVSEEFVKTGTELAIAEMLLSGTTCFADMYFYPNAAASAAHAAGMRAQFCFPVIDFPTAWASDADDYIHKGLELHDTFRSHSLITTAFGPHSPYTVSDKPLQRIATLAEELQIPVQIHLHETAKEVNDSIKETGKRPLQRLTELGLISPLTQCVHMTQVNDDDIATLTSTGASVIHCPQSNMKLASGTCPTQRLLEQSIIVGLGTDGAASNNDQDMFAEMQSAALLAKLHANSAEAMNAWQALELATINSAQALGLDSITGSLEIGKAADIIAVDMTAIELQPLYDIASQLVYCNNGSRVKHVWVNGTQLLKDRKLTRINTAELRHNVQNWQQKII